MATVKITDLPYIPLLQPNTANTVLVGVDIPGDYTGQLTLTTLAQGLYSNNNLEVGNNDIVYANAVGQFTGNSASYLQVVVRNQRGSGSSDFVATANDGDDGSHFIDMGINGSTYNDPTFSATKAHDGYLYVESNDSQGNLILGTASSDARINFVVGGIQTQNIVSYIDASGIFSPSINSLVAANVATLRGEVTANAASANSVINTRISANVATLRGEITANADSANSVINTRISANIATVNTFSQAAFDKANNALANSTGTFAGDLTITGNTQVARMNTANLSVVGTANVSGTLNVVGAVSMNSTLVLANSNFNATEAAMTIRATATVQTPSQAGTMLHVTGKANTPARIIYDSFSTDGSAYVVMAGRTGRGTVVSPTATQNNDILMRVAGNGWGSTGFAPLGVARIDIVASENYTDSARGSRIVFYNIPNGSNVVNQIASFNANTIEFTGTVAPEKGFIYTPTVLPGSQTAFTIDFSTTSLIKASLVADCTITLSNYVEGKVVEVWLTNTGGTNRTVTHGCTATNSTENSTTFTIPATSSAYLRYFSIDGDNANTFVAIQHA